MRAIIEGQVVRVGSEGWDFNGRSGISHFYYVRGAYDSPEDSAQRVRCERADQLPKQDQGIRAAVEIRVFEAERPGARPKLQVNHVEYVQAAKLHAAG
jgi:hypothetical protein